jgi:hypothetical protein
VTFKKYGDREAEKFAVLCRKCFKKQVDNGDV